MCFKENVTFFKAVNWCFMVIHMVFLVACVLVIMTRDEPLTVYYKIEVTHDQYIDVYPIYAALMTHTAGICFHLTFAVIGRYIVENYITYSYSNPLRWFLQFSVDGSSLLGLMLIHGFHTVQSVALIIIIYMAIIGFCYFQDHYLNPDDQFNPGKEPHMFAIPLHLLMILMIMGKANEHINDDKSLKIAVVTLISLSLTLVSYIIQRVHILYRSKMINSSGVGEESEGGDDDDQDLDLEGVIHSKSHSDRLDAIMDEVRRGVQYESYDYINSALFAMTVTWFSINVTQTNQTLH
jgi:hypothetical protein